MLPIPPQLVCEENGNVVEADLPGGEGGSGDWQPPCEFTGRFNEFCDPNNDENACWRNDPSFVQDPPTLKDVPPPHPDAHVIYWNCKRPDGSTYSRWFWSGTEPTQATLEQAARRAVAELPLPAFAARHSPPIDTLVNLDTWWWAEGPTDSPISGSALGVRASATPDRIEVDPGDGTDPLACPFVTEESDTCSHTYRRSSRTSPTDDDHSYTARMRMVYSIHFELNGNRISVPSAPSELPSSWSTTQISVKEAQAVVIH
jgi:hypothetical protein